MGRREKPLDPDAGPVQRLAHELRVLREEAGKPTYREMARRANYSTSALSAAATGEQFPSLAVLLAYVRALGADPGEWEERWASAKRAVEEQALEEAAAAEPRTAPPYRGLTRFEPGDSALFFGRDRLVGEVLGLVREHRFAAVSGPSGSGKSSLLRAGIVPALGALPTAERPAVIRVLTPGERPVHTHEKALTARDGDQDTWVLVDQFEELFTLCHDHAERERFCELLLAAREPGSRLRVVVAVRGDFYGHCAAHRALAEAVSRANMLVGPMSRDELREVITKPAAAVGLLVERALTARILDEAGDRPGALPMLSHALLETWRRRRGRTLTEAAYEAAGGVRGAIAATAERAYGELSPAQARTARRILLRLIAPGDGTPDTRRPAHRTDLPPGTADVLERLAAARLVTLDGDTVELAHEALITGWPRLAAWIDEDRERLREHRRLGEAARTWQELAHDPGALYAGTRLDRAVELFTGKPGSPGDKDDLTPVEHSFLTASLTARDTATRKRRIRTAALCSLLVLALAAGLLAWQQNRAGEEETAKAAARRIAAQSAGLRVSDPRTAALLGVAAWRTAALTESRSALLGAEFQPGLDAFTDPQTGSDTRRFLTRQGRTLISVAGRRVSVWDVAGRRRTGVHRLPAGMEAISAGPDGRTLQLSGAGEQVWDLARRKAVADLRESTLLDSSRGGYLVEPFDGPGPVRLLRTGDGKVLFETRPSGDLTTAALGADGRLLALCPAGAAPQVWDTARDRRLSGPWEKAKDLCGTGTGADAGASVLRFSPDGSRLAGLSGTTLDVWDVPHARLLASAEGTGAFTHAGLSPDGRFLATTDDQELAVWRLDDSAQQDSPQTRQVFRSPLTGTQPQDLAWDPGRGRRVLRLLDGPTVRSYDLTAALAPRWQRTPADASALSPDGTALATATRAGGGRYRFELRSTRTGAVLAKDTLGGLPTGTGESPLLAFSPDGGTLAVSDAVRASAERQRVTLWDVRAHRVRTRFELSGTDSPWSPLALGPGGRTLMISAAGATEVWEMNGERPRRTAVLRGFGGDAVAVRPDGRLLAGAGDQYADLSSRAVTGRGLADGRRVTALAFSPDGRRLAVGDESGRVTLWDGGVGHRTGVLTALAAEGGHEEVSALAFSPDGGTLAVGGDGDTLQLWDTGTQQPLGTDLPTPGDEIRSVAFGADGGTLYAAGAHVPLRRYPVAADRAVAAVCGRMRGGLTEAQWRTYLPDVPYRDIC
ncbi:helix-turn-helix domain-containing protein [Streptomyces sp. TRM68367]|uniref:nSTAND1 domain-containing NTPase n=1 Tax=Streptomyces sp. TRM68367 TaxID=2758415 RepID=UPI00165AD585|nr:helix-turn-helix domain-containing protein [Streptomyces sp. TRM68367]MBC9728943.1 helix-turn-helix domain-containing protein [Streptomyces sp. TRM68367]